RDDRDRPCGDFSCLQRLCEWAGDLGADYVSTLPVLAGLSTADDAAAVAGPYSPLSRMWWNEAYLDPGRIPELAGDPMASGSASLGETAGRLRLRADVAAAGGRLRPFLDAGLRALQRGGGRRLQEFEAFSAQAGDLRLYGLFRAAAEAFGLPSRSWPAAYEPGRLVSGHETTADIERAATAHMYAQWLCEQQLQAVGEAAADHGCALMLDLPIGSRPDGFDPWAYPGSFAGVVDGDGVSVGAPPDRFFQAGQNWGFRPLSPEGERQAGYPVMQACLSRLMRHCGALRIDHVMGLQRLWWIPSGAPASQGAYVHYHFEEILALTCLEAWRHDVAVAGEDLGTVDAEVRRKLQDHAIAGMHVAVFDLAARPDQPLRPRAGSMALVDTHDTATFAGWLEAADVDVRRRFGFLDQAEAADARETRQDVRRRLTSRLVGAALLDAGSADSPTELHAAVLDELGSSRAGLVGVNIEDLWAETEPQNIPGTADGHANFSHRLAFSLAEIESSPVIAEPLRRLDLARRRAAAATSTRPGADD
ncbi:MAG TPA: 4-alpha-glucanotransferase, partial [Acidimicrobiales bacterium]|nr:4-alpha-glucanotransferase [Acidimicrobiales bacterium]